MEGWVLEKQLPALSGDSLYTGSSKFGRCKVKPRFGKHPYELLTSMGLRPLRGCISNHKEFIEDLYGIDYPTP